MLTAVVVPIIPSLRLSKKRKTLSKMKYANCNHAEQNMMLRNAVRSTKSCEKSILSKKQQA